MLSYHRGHGKMKAPSLCNSPVALNRSLTINAINEETERGKPPSITTHDSTNFEFPHITEPALIAIVEDSRTDHISDVPSRDLADASIPICRASYHEGVISGDNSIIFAAQSQVASCLSRLGMFHHYEEENMLETRQNLEEMGDDLQTRTASNKGQLVWDLVRDNDVLREFCRSQQNLMFDSLYPELAPHIVVTTVEETWNDGFIQWQNCVNFQRPEYLTVPHYPALLDCCPTDAGHLKVIDDASIERLVLHRIVRTLQKQRCKAAFFDACNVAMTFRKRYDSLPDRFNAIATPYVWSDPAERLRGTTIIDSHSPFRVPHIIINAPPPQDLWIPWNNAINKPQDHGYGRFLIVPSSSVEVINTSIEDRNVYSLSNSSVAGLTVDPSESSRPGTPTPQTPVDDVDLSFFVVRPGEDIGGDVDSFDYPSLLNFKSVSNEPPCASDLPRSSRPIFSIEEDEDDLPPFDDWYKQ
ncbi:hypothetical protein L208DRAFT_1374871 [Tricholoma matsutake]|nr:hypothetical protein L208DRAFT_1374871 [Tricholoma matsutake 945]